jgi:hypothetical protein
MMTLASTFTGFIAGVLTSVLFGLITVGLSIWRAPKREEEHPRYPNLAHAGHGVAVRFNQPYIATDETLTAQEEKS